MTAADWCVLVAGLLPILTVAFAKWGQKNYDNHEPRAWLENQQGFRRRADYAHRNHFEAFPFFAAAVLVAQQADAAQGAVNGLAAAFVALRLAYTFCYLTDRATARSIAWALAYACVLGIFLAAARAN